MKKIIGLIMIAGISYGASVVTPPGIQVNGLATNNNVMVYSDGMLLDSGVAPTNLVSVTNLTSDIEALSATNAAQDALIAWNSNLVAGAVQRSDGSSIVVERGATPEASWVALTNAYEIAKAFAPGGNALSATNRAAVIVTPGTYICGTNTLIMDTDYVDIISANPMLGGLPVTNYLPGNVIFEGIGDAIIEQTCNDVRLVGISCIQRQVDRPALRVAVDAADASYYEKLYLYTDYSTGAESTSEDGYMHKRDVSGYWKDCISAGPDENVGGLAWRIRWSTTEDTFFSATMINCYAGNYCIGGDDDFTSTNFHGFKGAYLENCHTLDFGFGGCDSWSCESDSNSVFVGCTAGKKSFVVGNKQAGTLLNCRAKELSGGSVFVEGDYFTGGFSGYAKGCVFGEGSFGGGGQTALTPIYSGTNGWLSGTVIDCTIGGGGMITSSVPTMLKGGTIINSHYAISTPNTDAFLIGDDGSRIINTVVDVAGTGLVANATSSRGLYFKGNSYTNEDFNSRGGIGAYVKNTSGPSTNSVSSTFLNGSNEVYVASLYAGRAGIAVLYVDPAIYPNGVTYQTARVQNPVAFSSDILIINYGTLSSAGTQISMDFPSGTDVELTATPQVVPAGNFVFLKSTANRESPFIRVTVYFTEI